MLSLLPDVIASTSTSGSTISRGDCRNNSAFQTGSPAKHPADHPANHTEDTSSRHEPPAAVLVGGIIVALLAVLTVLAIAFALPAAGVEHV